MTSTLKCFGCLINPKRGIRNAITVFDGIAMCSVHLEETIRAIKKVQEDLAKQQQKERVEKKVEVTCKDALISPEVEVPEG